MEKQYALVMSETDSSGIRQVLGPFPTPESAQAMHDALWNLPMVQPGKWQIFEMLEITTLGQIKPVQETIPGA